MPGASDIAIGNQKNSWQLYLANVTFPTLTTNASAVTSVTLNGTLPLDMVSWNIQAGPAHLQIDNIYVSAANTLSITWGTDASGVTGAATLNVLFTVERATNGNLGVSALPGAIV